MYLALYDSRCSLSLVLGHLETRLPLEPGAAESVYGLADSAMPQTPSRMEQILPLLSYGKRNFVLEIGNMRKQSYVKLLYTHTQKRSYHR